MMSKYKKGEVMGFNCLQEELMEGKSKTSSSSSTKAKGEEESESLIKKRISTHPMYALLLQTHLDCLKVGGICDGDQSHNMKQEPDIEKPSFNSVSQPDLDHFMEAYCSALRKLKEAMEEPQQESIAFINSMHLQLMELTASHNQTGNEMINTKNYSTDKQAVQVTEADGSP